MRATLQVINALEQDSVISRYAIGGAVGATFYMEPFATFDLDIFVVLPVSGILLTLQPLYEALSQKGYAPIAECVEIEGVHVQFLPAHNALLEEALAGAGEIDYDGVPTRVMSAEHLAAIMVQTGRPKDRQRLQSLREQATLDEKKLQKILTDHHLDTRFQSWTQTLNS